MDVEVEITTDAAAFVIDDVVMFGGLVFYAKSVVVEDEVNDGVLLLQLYLMLCRMLL